MQTNEIAGKGLDSILISTELESKIIGFYENYLNAKLSYIGDDLDWKNDEISETKRKIDNEKKFYCNVLESFYKAIIENPSKKIIMLFDIDETLVSNNKTKDNDIMPIIRPSAISMFSFIKHKGGFSGFLTNRTEVKEQLNNKLQKLKPYVDESYIFSTRDVGDVSGKEQKELERKIPQDIINTFDNGDFEKMIFLNKLIDDSDNNDKIFIPIDDLKYPMLYKYGVTLYNNKFYI